MSSTASDPDKLINDASIKAKQYETKINNATNGATNVTTNGTISDKAVKDTINAQKQDLADTLKEDAQAGANVYSFDPDASPQEKAQVVAKAPPPPTSAPPPIPVPSSSSSANKIEKAGGGLEIPSDIGTGDQEITPTHSAKDALPSPPKPKSGSESDQEKNKKQQEQEASAGNDKDKGVGAYPDGRAPTLPEKEKIWIGWSAVPESETGLSKEERRQRSLLEEWVGEAWYGTIFHNAGVIFVSVFAAHFVTLFGGGFGFMFLILAFCATYYSVSYKRTMHRARDDLSREVSKKRLFVDHETADWINNFLSRFWIIYEPVLSATIVASVDQVLATSTPAFLDSLKMSYFTLGNKSPRVEFVRSYPKTEDDVVVMDWKFSFMPHDLSNPDGLSVDKVNTKIVLTIRIGKGAVGVSHDVVVEDITFRGLIRLRLKLVNNYPHVQTVDISFLEQPLIDYVLKPIGFDLSLIPGLAGFIDSQVHSNLGPMMYDPNTFTLNLEQMLAGEPIDTAVGVVQVTLYNARGLKATKIGGGTPDPYISFSVGNRAEVAKSKIRHSTNNPRWNETKFILVNNINEVLSMKAFDWNEHRKDNELGTANFDLQSLDQEPEREGLRTPLLMDGKEKGYVHYDLKYFPVHKPVKLEDGTEEPVPETQTGIVRLVVHQAKDLDATLSSVGALTPYAQVYLRGQQVFQTHAVKRSNNPTFESPTEFLVTDREKAVIGIKMVDERGFVKDPMVGFLSLKLNDILTANENGEDWFPFSRANSGTVRLSASWKPVMMAGAVAGAGNYRPPIGVVRFWIKKAADLRNIETIPGGRSDPYLRVICNGVISSKTTIYENNLNPTWDEILYVPVHGNKDRFTVEVMDYENSGADRGLGVFYLYLKDFIQEGSDKQHEPWISSGQIKRTDRLIQDAKKNVTKGTVSYYAEFYPCANIDVNFDPVENPLDKAKELAAAKQTPESAQLTEMVNGDTDNNNKQEGDEGDEDDDDGGKSDNEDDKASVHTTDSAVNETVKEAEAEEKKGQEDKITLTREEILSAPSGLLAVNIISGVVPKKGCRLELYVNEGYWPFHSSELSRSNNVTWDEIGEVFVGERDVSSFVMKLNAGSKEASDDVIGVYSASIDEFLGLALDQQVELSLSDPSGEYGPSKVKLQARYVPLPLELEPQESINNSGFLRVDLLNGKDLPAMDRNGKSDPYVRFVLNGQEVYKSETKKKTVNPKWNENFEIEIPSRVGAKFILKAYDWDAVGAADKMGNGKIDLTGLEPFEAQDYTVKITQPESGKQQGEINLRFVFRPQFIARRRPTSSTFGGAAGRVATGIGGGVVGVAGGAVKGVGMVGKGVGGVGKGVFGFGRRITGLGGSREATPSIIEQDEIDDAADAGLDTSMVSTARQSTDGLVPGGGGGGGAPGAIPGIVKITVNNATAAGGSDHAKVAITKNGKNLEKKSRGDEVYTVKTSGDPLVLTVTLVDKKFLNSKNMGTVEVDVWQIVNSLVPENVKNIEFEDGGSVELHFALTPREGGSGGNALQESTSSHTAPDTPASTKTGRSKFSIRRSQS